LSKKKKAHDSANSQNPRLMTNAPPENKKNSTFWRCFPLHHSPMHKMTVTTTVGKRQILNCDEVLKAMRGAAPRFFECRNEIISQKNHPTWHTTREI
jgi:hypothetical protein